MSQWYEFAISLRIWHPSMLPASITKRLRLSPHITKTAGAARRTPQGNLLGGVNRESYWSADITPRGMRSSKRQRVEAHIARLSRKLIRHGEFFKQIHRDGGQVRIWVDSHSQTNYTFELTPTCLELLARAGIAVVFDVYPHPQNW